MDPLMVLSDMRHQYYRKIGQSAQSHHVSSIQNMTNSVMITDMCLAQPGFNATLPDNPRCWRRKGTAPSVARRERDRDHRTLTHTFRSRGETWRQGSGARRSAEPGCTLFDLA